jgi:tetratricopeptide (TPR) repeat protein
MGHVLCNLGQVLRGQGALEAARATFDMGLTIAHDLGDLHMEAQYWTELGLTAYEQGDPAGALRFAQDAVDRFAELGLEVMATCDLCTVAEAKLALGARAEAESAVRMALEILQRYAGEGPDYPQRDFYRCGTVLRALGQVEPAEVAEEHAYRLLMERAERIGDAELRHAFLTAIPIHAAIAAGALSGGGPVGTDERAAPRKERRLRRQE